MDLKLEGRRALVTGSTAGIGFAVARKLAAEGATVVVNGRSRDGVEHPPARIAEAVPGADIGGVAADAGSAQGAEAIRQRFPDLDILVNNLGIFEPKPVFDLPTRTEGVTDFLDRLAKESGATAQELERDFFKNARPSSLIRRFADPDEVANMAAYLCDDVASATTGAAVRVDGGVVNSIVP